MKKVFLTFCLGSLIFATSCDKTNEGKNDQLEEAIDSDSESQPVAEDTSSDTDVEGDEGILSVSGLGSIPDPIIAATLIKETGAQYDKSALNTIEKRSIYSKSYEKALNLGIYSADLAFANIYTQNQDAIDYLTAIKDLSSNLNIDKHFDFAKLKTLTESGASLDELLEITLKSFQNTNNALKDEGRSEMSIFILSGSWLEALYLSCYVAKTNKNKDLRLNIADQKTQILPKVINVLKNNKDKSEHIGKLLVQMERIKTAFEPISVEYGDLENITVETETGTEVNQTSNDVLKGNDEDFTKLFNVINEVRKEIIK